MTTPLEDLETQKAMMNNLLLFTQSLIDKLGIPKVNYTGNAASFQSFLDKIEPGSEITVNDDKLLLGRFALPSFITLQGGIYQSPDNRPALITKPSAQAIICRKLTIQPNLGIEGTHLEFGSTSTTDVTIQPRNILLDSIFCVSTIGRQKRGLSLHGSDIRINNCNVTDIGIVGNDSQPLWINNGPGPYLITNNYFEGGSEIILFGGDKVHIDGLVPSDIIISGNYLTRKLTQMGKKFNVKNLLEFKNARRVKVFNNKLTNNWGDAQSGYAILVTPRNQGPNPISPWTVCEDIDFYDNSITEVSSAFNISGDDDEAVSLRTNNIKIRRNFVKTNITSFPGDGRFVMIGRAPNDVLIENNTTDTDGGSWIYSYTGGKQFAGNSLIVRNNIGRIGLYGFNVQTAHFTNLVFQNNVLGGTASNITKKVGSYYPTLDEWKASFMNYIEQNYNLSNPEYITKQIGKEFGLVA